MTPAPLIDLNTLILFFGACQAMFFIVLLAFKHQQMRAINLHIAIVLLAIGCEVSHQFLLQSHYIYQVPELVGFSLPFDALVAISLYWYVRLITHPECNHSFGRVFAHYGIFFLCVLLSIPFWTLGFEQKLTLMKTGVVPTEWPFVPYYATLIQAPIKIISFCVYLVLAIRLLLHHRARIKDIFSHRQRITLNWLSVLLALFVAGLLNGLIILIFFQESSDSLQVMGFMGAFSLIAIIYIGTMGLMQPVIYPPAEQAYLEKSVAADEDANSTKEKYQHSSLSPTDMQRIATKLDRALRENTLYLDATLSMPTLAAYIGVSPNYLSQTINTLYQTNFFDFINRYRVEHAKNLLKDTNNEGTSIIDIALASAFNSRSTFYSAFKQHVGTTPAQFRRSAKTQS